MQADDRQRRRSPKLPLLRVVLLVLGVVAIALGSYNARTNERELKTIPFPASEAERAKGVVRGLATFHPDGAFPVPPCIAEWKKNSNGKTSVQEREVLASGYPKFVPILDGTGRGVLSVEHCRVDAGEEPPITWADGAPAAPAWFFEAVSVLPRSDTHRFYRAHWVVVERGEPLLIYGGVDRVLPSSVGVPDGAAYRFDPNIPLVRGREDEPAFAYVGLESALLGAIARERVALALSLLAWGGAVAAAWVAFAWIVRQ